MSLPKLATPKFDIKIPSTGKMIKIRPFLVKEQKLILNAIEMRDKNQLNNALDDVLRACTFDEVDIDELTVYDIEYLIAQIRARSVGDIVEINYICKNEIDDKLLNAEALKFDPNTEEVRGKGICETKIPLKINIANLECQSGDRPDNRIMFTDTVGVVMRDMPYGTYKDLSTIEEPSRAALYGIASCIHMVINGDEVIHNDEIDMDELVEWIESLTADDFDKLDVYIKSMPTLHMEITIKCPNCGAEEQIELRGLDDFLA